MKAYLLQMLKELALLGAINNRVEISSLELANQLETSQQTASRYVLELDKLDLITREMGIKKQLIQITDNGADTLKEEYIQYKHIFELPQKIRFDGHLVSGMGEGTYYLAQDGYVNQFHTQCGFKPYPGTLNVKIPQIEKNKLRLIKKFPGIEIEEFKTENRTFGAVKCFHATVNEEDCILVLPVRGHYSNILEFISPKNLRKKLEIEDGDPVHIMVNIQKQID
jgi:riboflavin kinase, archaea type